MNPDGYALGGCTILAKGRLIATINHARFLSQRCARNAIATQLEGSHVGRPPTLHSYPQVVVPCPGAAVAVAAANTRLWWGFETFHWPPAKRYRFVDADDGDDDELMISPSSSAPPPFRLRRVVDGGGARRTPRGPTLESFLSTDEEEERGVAAAPPRIKGLIPNREDVTKA
eukprot:scaffold1872_cov262-Amphora_coffeaeformis.AAC.16